MSRWVSATLCQKKLGFLYASASSRLLKEPNRNLHRNVWWCLPFREGSKLEPQNILSSFHGQESHVLRGLSLLASPWCQTIHPNISTLQAKLWHGSVTRWESDIRFSIGSVDVQSTEDFEKLKFIVNGT